MKRIVCYLLALSLAFGCAVLAESVQLTDMTGRTVELEEVPERIVSGYYISTSTLIALGVRDSIVGIESKADTRALYAGFAPEMCELPNVGSAKEFDPEGCAALEPDLVVLPKKLADAAETLSSLGIPVLLVDPEDQARLEEMVTLLGAAAGREDEAQALLSRIHEIESALSQAVEGAEKPSVYIASNSALLRTAGAGMYQSAVVDMAGGRNAAAEIGEAYWADVSYEQLLAWDPDYILLPADASYTAEEVCADEDLQGLRAVTEGHVICMPGEWEAWDSPVPGSVLGAMWLAGRLHPDLVTEEMWKDSTESFYTEFYGRHEAE